MNSRALLVFLHIRNLLLLTEIPVLQEVISNHNKETVNNSYGRLDPGRLDAGPRSSYSQSSYPQLGNTSHPQLGGDASRIPSSSLPSQPYPGYGSSGLGDYSTFRL